MRPLTEPEFRIMLKLVAGKSRAEIASHLGIHPATMGDRITAIRIKLNAATIDQALAAFKKVNGLL